MGRPKALVRDADGTSWLQRAVEVLLDGGCNGVTVVLGAGADEAVSLLDGLGVDVVVAHDWDEGMSASLRSGLESLMGSDAEAAVVTLVDLPDLTAAVVRRVLSERGGVRAVAVGARGSGAPRRCVAPRPAPVTRWSWAGLTGPPWPGRPPATL